MIRGIDNVTIFSEDAKKLAFFYKDKVGLKLTLEAQMGEKGEELYGFEFKKSSDLYIVDHSKVKDKNKFPERIIVDFEVGNIDNEIKRLEKAGVKKIQRKYHIEGYGYIATFEDIDGNYFQLVQVKPN
ncbi:hypothetical protein A2691_01415 [Candidatus Woesebacteria bacterium RIFCSPHIGHO2_01_FULL_39_23]|nr:MAG: hypothetical protein A2691_01415 [Candidatus Woesebacteria bacterium RIFCSPHIGHO2_01_FULL_39_23]